MKDNADKMIDMIAEACEIALGAEWHAMTAQQKHDTIMGFIAKVAKNAREK